MILNKSKATISDGFSVVTAGDVQEHSGLVTIQIKSRITGETKYLRFDPYAELLASAVSPARAATILDRFANVGFRISPLPDALREFFHVALFPEDAVTLIGSISIERLPEGAVIEAISTIQEMPNE